MDIHLLFRQECTYLSIRKGICDCSRLNLHMSVSAKVVGNACTYLYANMTLETREKLRIAPFMPRQEDAALPTPCIECLSLLAEELETWRHGHASHVYE